MDTPQTTTAIEEYRPTEAALMDLATKYKDAVFDVATVKGMAAAKEARAHLRSLRVNLEKKRVEIKEPALKRTREIDTEAARIKERIAELETPIDEQIKADEIRRENERKKREEAEAARVKMILDSIAEFPNSVGNAADKSSDEIADMIDNMKAHPITTDTQYAPQAQMAKDAALFRLSELRAAATEREQAAIRAAEERAELDRRKKEQDARDAAAAQEREAEAARRAEEDRQRAEQERIAREAREAEERAHRARIEAEEAAARAKRDAEAKAAQDAIDAANRAAEDRRQQEEAAHRAAMEAETRAAEQRRADARAEQDRLDAQAREQREHEEELRRERIRLENEKTSARDMLGTFTERFGHLPEFAKINAAITAYFKAHP